jgi:hypothetical protein
MHGPDRKKLKAVRQLRRNDRRSDETMLLRPRLTARFLVDAANENVLGVGYVDLKLAKSFKD